MTDRTIVIGGGPAGLMAAEKLAEGGVAVDLYEAMPSVGRKFLMAGKGGLNITHSEPLDKFTSRYGAQSGKVAAWFAAFGPDHLRAWIHDLGIATFIGSSGRVFPDEMKAAPLLRAWLHRLRQSGVRIHVRHRWLGWAADGALRFATPLGERLVAADVMVLALGGGSWPQLGSDGAWQTMLTARQVEVAPLVPANCGFEIDWSEHVRTRFAGEPLKNIAAAFRNTRVRGEAIVTEHGIEGGLIYALSGTLRDAIAAQGEAVLLLDLLPNHDVAQIADVLAQRGSRSLSSHLKSQLKLMGVKAGLLRECLGAEILSDPARLAAGIKALPLRLSATRPLAEAISSAGGVRFDSVDAGLMLNKLPGVFCAGEMLDWEAPTGGYLLTACFASGHVAGTAALARIKARGVSNR